MCLPRASSRKVPTGTRYLHTAEIYARYLVYTRTYKQTCMIHTTLHGNVKIVLYSCSCINGCYISAQCGTGKYCTGTIMNAHVSAFEWRTYWIFSLFTSLLPYDVDHTKTKMFKNSRTEHTRIIHTTYQLQYTVYEQLIFPLCDPGKKSKND